LNNLPKRLSYSYIHQYTCPYAAFLRYEGNIRGKTTEYLALGNAFHHAVELGHTVPEWNIKDVVETFQLEFRRIIDDENVFIDFPRLKKREAEGIEMIELYSLNLESGLIERPIAVELEFSLPVGETTIVGRIDKLDGGSGNYSVTDYKTGQKAPDTWFLHHNLQFTTYAWAILEMYGELPKTLFWYQARTGKLLETHRTIQDIEELKTMLGNVITMNNMGIKYRVYNERVCEWCEFSDGWGKKGICDDRQLERDIEAKIKEQQDIDNQVVPEELEE